MTIQIQTINDARTAFVNSGYIDMFPELTGDQENRLIRLIYTASSLDDGVRAFIIDELRQDPSDYGL